MTAAVELGLTAMGYPVTTAYYWVVTDTYQLLSHGIDPASNALGCNDCHGGSRMDLKGDLGHRLKSDASGLCIQCHDHKEYKPFETIHNKHVKDKKYDCSHCHEFTRPERGLKG